MKKRCAVKLMLRMFNLPVLILTPDYFFSYIEVHAELQRMRAHTHGLNLFFAFVCNPAFDDVRGEDITLEEKVVIGFERFQGIVERAGQRRHVL